MVFRRTTRQSDCPHGAHTRWDPGDVGVGFGVVYINLRRRGAPIFSTRPRFLHGSRLLSFDPTRIPRSVHRLNKSGQIFIPSSCQSCSRSPYIYNGLSLPRVCSSWTLVCVGSWYSRWRWNNIDNFVLFSSGFEGRREGLTWFDVVWEGLTWFEMVWRGLRWFERDFGKEFLFKRVWGWEGYW